ncbi:hypothetical protein TCDM_05497 [Trypanosoma cruzi Dm28c]|uniref:Uncharacterized protein n=1 Tax=Trypanosoma cruzi Dm28c TaxID=1416333 RepID=V5BIR0_TRYCR|nr:hypothetical protein TCDM_05497 [Trypanosoma cruzi Dm28c]
MYVNGCPFISFSFCSFSLSLLSVKLRGKQHCRPHAPLLLPTHTHTSLHVSLRIKKTHTRPIQTYSKTRYENKCGKGKKKKKKKKKGGLLPFCFIFIFFFFFCYLKIHRHFLPFIFYFFIFISASPQVCKKTDFTRTHTHTHKYKGGWMDGLLPHVGINKISFFFFTIFLSLSRLLLFFLLLVFVVFFFFSLFFLFYSCLLPGNSLASCPFVYCNVLLPPLSIRHKEEERNSHSRHSSSSKAPEAPPSLTSISSLPLYMNIIYIYRYVYGAPVCIDVSSLVNSFLLRLFSWVLFLFFPCLSLLAVFLLLLLFVCLFLFCFVFSFFDYDYYIILTPLFYPRHSTYYPPLAFARDTPRREGTPSNSPQENMHLGVFVCVWPLFLPHPLLVATTRWAAAAAAVAVALASKSLRATAPAVAVTASMPFVRV